MACDDKMWPLQLSNINCLLALLTQMAPAIMIKKKKNVYLNKAIIHEPKTYPCRISQII